MSFPENIQKIVELLFNKLDKGNIEDKYSPMIKYEKLSS